MKSTVIKKEIILLEEKMKNLLKSGTMTKNQFAKKAHVNVTWIYPWLQGKRQTRFEQILDMAENLGL